MSGRPSPRHSSRPDPLPSAPHNDNDHFIYDTAEFESSEVSPLTSRESTVFSAYPSWSTPGITGEQPMNAKVAIPRLEPPLANSNGRVSRACHNCRKQKNKCSGHRPSCIRCQEANVLCVYVDGKRERNARSVIFLDMVAQNIYPST